MPRLQYRGCVYADPKASSREANERDLTTAELRQMRLVGLPVRIEHGSRALVGRVCASKTDQACGYTTVDIELDDSAGGNAAAALIDRGTISQLSLCHNVMSDDSKVPVEVSLVNEGARPDTVIFREADLSHDEAVKRYITRVLSPTRDRTPTHADDVGFRRIVMASAQEAPAATIEQPAPAVEKLAEAAAPSVTPPAEKASMEEPPAKRLKELPLQDKIEAVAASLDAEKQGALFEALAEFTKQRNDAQSLAAAAKKAKDEMEARYAATKDNTSTMARQLALVLDDVYRHFGLQKDQPKQEEQEKIVAGFNDMAERHPEAYQHVQKLQVACSKMLASEHKHTQAIADQRAAEAKVANDYASEMKTRFLGMNANFEHPFEPMKAAAAAAVPALAAPPPAPVGVVAASAHEAPVPAPGGGLPTWLRESCAGFENVGTMSAKDVFSHVK